jgi:hypothetical protein
MTSEQHAWRLMATDEMRKLMTRTCRGRVDRRGKEARSESKVFRIRVKILDGGLKGRRWVRHIIHCSLVGPEVVDSFLFRVRAQDFDGDGLEALLRLQRIGSGFLWGTKVGALRWPQLVHRLRDRLK